MKRIVFIPTLLLAAGLALPASADAGPFGSLTQLSGPDGCLNNDGGDCKGASAVTDPVAVVASADGKHVYAATLSGGVAVLSRDTTTGALTQTSCINSGGTGGCSASAGLDTVLQEMAISPDGKNVYVVGLANDRITTLNRNATTGQLSFGGCFGPSGCTTIISPMSGPSSVTVSPDNKNVYVTAGGAPYTVIWFNRNDAGALSDQECISDDPTGLCGPQANIANSLQDPRDVVVSPDGEQLYVAALSTITTVDRVPSTGQLLAATGATSCIGTVAGCSAGQGLLNVDGVVVSPDGNNAYSAAFSSNAVAQLKRASNGVLSQPPGFTPCFSTPAAGGCESALGLANASTIAISPDGMNVYAGTSENPDAGGNSLTTFARNSADGDLDQLASPFGCLTPTGSGGCGAARALDEVEGMTVSPDGNSVYSAAYRTGDRGIGVYSRELPPVCTAPPLQTSRNDQPVGVPMPCSDPNGDPITRAVATQPKFGRVTINQPAGRGTYDPTGRYHGADSFTFTASDGSLTSNAATASIQLTDKIGPLIELGGRTLRMNKQGITKVSIKCPKTEVDGCPKGKLEILSSRRIRATIKRRIKRLGKATFTLKAGKSKAVKVKLNRTARRAVRRLRNVRVNLSARSTDLAGNTGKVTKATHLKVRRR